MHGELQVADAFGARGNGTEDAHSAADRSGICRAEGAHEKGGCVSLNRHAARRDENEARIVEDLRKVGAKVEQLDRPDLIVRFRFRTYLMEVENPQNKYRNREKDQLRFLEEFEIPVVKTSDEALRVIGAI